MIAAYQWPCEVVLPGAGRGTGARIKLVSEHAAWVAAKAAHDQVVAGSGGLREARVRLGCLLVEIRARTERGTWRYEQQRRGIHYKRAIRALNDVAALRHFSADQRAAVGLGVPDQSTTVGTRCPGVDGVLGKHGGGVRPLQPPSERAPVADGRAGSAGSGTAVVQTDRGGATPSPALSSVRGEQLGLDELYRVAERATAAMKLCMEDAAAETGVLPGLFAAIRTFAETLEGLHSRVSTPA